MQIITAQNAAELRNQAMSMRKSPPVFRALPEKEQSVRLEKSNILLVGPSGVGKTFLTQTLARYVFFYKNKSFY